MPSNSDHPISSVPLLAEPRTERLEAQLNGVMNCLAISQQEVERLRAGRFTPEEFQNLCHGLSEEDKAAFFAGCADYQRKLFGVAACDELRTQLTASQQEIENLKLNLDKQTQEVVRTLTQTADCVQALAASQQRVAELEQQMETWRQRALKAEIHASDVVSLRRWSEERHAKLESELREQLAQLQASSAELLTWVDTQLEGIRHSSVAEASRGAYNAFRQVKERLQGMTAPKPAAASPQSQPVPVDDERVKAIVNAVWNTVDHNEIGEVWMDRAKAVAAVKSLLVTSLLATSGESK